MFGLKKSPKKTTVVEPKIKLGPEEIKSLPERFAVAASAGLGRNAKIAIGLGVGLAVVGAGVIFFSFDWSAPKPAPVNLVVNNENQNVNVNTNENANINTNENQNANANVNGNENVNNDNANLNVININETNGNENVNVNEPVAVDKLVGSLDTDGDSLTDVEEELFKTDKNKPDTDADGYVDGQEVRSGYDPTKGAGAKLVDSNLAKEYSNLPYKYKILYPATWKVKTIDDRGAQIIIQPETGQEFMEVIVIDGVNALAKWYQDSVSQTNTEPTVGSLNGWQVVRSEDGLTVYLSQRNLGRVYILNYNSAGLKEINYQTTLEMMVNSFALVVTK